MEKWLDCTISQGQFSDEYAVRGELFDNSTFSLFAQEKDLKFGSEKPMSQNSVKGGIRVKKLGQKDDLVLVALPQPALENGRTVTVKTNQIK